VLMTALGGGLKKAGDILKIIERGVGSTKQGTSGACADGEVSRIVCKSSLDCSFVGL
jgi:hypothetical protein